mmetsp:Transcript_19729/g.29099  ORF Transcript_19729/g.29099 Transcript_19729/m.29099 type:complete len:89 (+) Transcript_19729:211-477(+)
MLLYDMSGTWLPMVIINLTFNGYSVRNTCRFAAFTTFVSSTMNLSRQRNILSPLFLKKSSSVRGTIVSEPRLRYKIYCQGLNQTSLFA